MWDFLIYTNMYDKRLRDIRVELLKINNEYSKKNIEFSIKDRVRGQLNIVHKNFIIKNIEYDNTFNFFKINFFKVDTYIKVTIKSVALHSRFENIEKSIFEEGEIITIILLKLKKFFKN